MKKPVLVFCFYPGITAHYGGLVPCPVKMSGVHTPGINPLQPFIKEKNKRSFA
jgi:hypothetical protein